MTRAARVARASAGTGRREAATGASSCPVEAESTPDTPDSVCSWKARSRADWKRSSGFFSRQCRTIRSIAGLMWRALSVRSGGSSFRIALMVSTAESPLNARRPESIS